jgi:hypothetical protein
VQEFIKQTKDRVACGGEITACVGIAIVKAHYPFARAYTLADALCKSAKTYRRELVQEGEKWEEDWGKACLDWHFALSGLAGSLQDIRRREYDMQSQAHKDIKRENGYLPNRLYIRPLTLGQNPGERFRAWPVVRRLLSAFQEEEWSAKRNKLKALRDALRAGPEAVKQFLTQFEAQLPKVDEDLQIELPQDSWVAWGSPEGGRCVYFDAVEMADWFMPLQGAETDET